MIIKGNFYKTNDNEKEMKVYNDNRIRFSDYFGQEFYISFKDMIAFIKILKKEYFNNGELND